MAGRTRVERGIVTAAAAALAVLAPPAEAGLVGPFAKQDYPQAVIDRPLTLPAGMVEGEVGAQFVSRSFELPPDIHGADDWFGDLAVRVGVTDRIQLEAGTAFSLDHVQRGDSSSYPGGPEVDIRPSLASWQRIVPLRLSLLALDTETLDTAVTLTLPFVAHARREVVFTVRSGYKTILTNGDGRVLPEVELGAPTRWRLTDYLWLRAGQDLFAVTTGDGTARFAFVFGMGVQPHRLVALTIDTSFAEIAFDGSGHDSTVTLADAAPLRLEMTFSPLPIFDLVGSFDLPDLGLGFGDYATRVAVRVRF